MLYIPYTKLPLNLCKKLEGSLFILAKKNINLMQSFHFNHTTLFFCNLLIKLQYRIDNFIIEYIVV